MCNLYDRYEKNIHKYKVLILCTYYPLLNIKLLIQLLSVI